MQEYRIFGPPGTGKTHRLVTRDIPRAVERFGSDRVMITSFTRAAARELASRVDPQTPAGEEQLNRQGAEGGTARPDTHHPPTVGTLHSICWNALGRPELHLKHLDEWNQQNPSMPMRGSAQGTLWEEGGEDPNAGGELGDTLLGEMQLLRARLTPPEMWPLRIQVFAKRWEDFKGQLGLMDFTDLLEVCLREMDHAPGNPAVMFLDEAQDADGLQLKLFRHWAQNAEWSVLAGDDDQTIFEWAGSSPQFFLTPAVDARHKTVLTQSYRVPRAVHRRAVELTERISLREPKEYLPRPEDGELAMSPYGWRLPMSIMNEVEEQLSQGRSVMILASCAYMLDPAKAELRNRAIPFHNPYRKTRGDWNPLAPSSANSVSARDLLLSFLGHGEDGPYWSVPRLLSWVKYLQVGPTGLVRAKGKKAIAALQQALEDNVPGAHTSREVLAHILSPEAIEPALARNLDWLIDNISNQRRKGLDFPLRVLRRGGLRDLEQTPRVVLGTIHSVKGGEADTVILYPDLSPKSLSEWGEGRPAFKDYVRRVFYVAMTRARQRLVLCGPSGGGVRF